MDSTLLIKNKTGCCEIEARAVCFAMKVDNQGDCVTGDRAG